MISSRTSRKLRNILLTETHLTRNKTLVIANAMGNVATLSNKIEESLTKNENAIKDGAQYKPGNIIEKNTKINDNTNNNHKN